MDDKRRYFQRFVTVSAYESSLDDGVQGTDVRLQRRLMTVSLGNSWIGADSLEVVGEYIASNIWRMVGRA